MKVMQLLTQGSGGPADHVADVAPLLAARGHDVTVVMPDGAAADRVDAAGVARVPSTMASKTDAAGARALVRLLRRVRPDVLHCQDRRAGLLGRPAARSLRVPGIVYTAHGVPESLGHLVPGNLPVGEARRRDRLYYLTFERALSRVARGPIVVPSDALARYVIDHVGVAADSVTVVRNGVDADRFRPGKGSGGGFRVVWLGLMVPVKRLDVLLSALREVPEVTAVLAGDGPLRAAVADAARSLGPKVELPGFVDDPAALLASADAFVLPSAAENCPLSLLQAMATGLPVIASRVGGIPEIVSDGESGLLVPPGDAASLAAALSSLAADPALRSRLGSAARARVEGGLDLDTCVAGLEAVYERARR